MTDIAQLHRELVNRVLDSDAQAPRELRRAAFDNAGLDEPVRTLIEKVAQRSYQVTDEDAAAVHAAGLSEDQIFEIMVCGARPRSSPAHEGAVRCDSRHVAPAGGRRRQAGVLPEGLLRRRRSDPRGDAGAVGLVGR